MSRRFTLGAARERLSSLAASVSNSGIPKTTPLHDVATQNLKDVVDSYHFETIADELLQKAFQHSYRSQEYDHERVMILLNAWLRKWSDLNLSGKKNRSPHFNLSHKDTKEMPLQKAIEKGDPQAVHFILYKLDESNHYVSRGTKLIFEENPRKSMITVALQALNTELQKALENPSELDARLLHDQIEIMSYISQAASCDEYNACDTELRSDVVDSRMDVSIATPMELAKYYVEQHLPGILLSKDAIHLKALRVMFPNDVKSHIAELIEENTDDYKQLLDGDIDLNFIRELSSCGVSFSKPLRDSWGNPKDSLLKKMVNAQRADVIVAIMSGANISLKGAVYGHLLNAIRSNVPGKNEVNGEALTLEEKKETNRQMLNEINGLILNEMVKKNDSLLINWMVENHSITDIPNELYKKAALMTIPDRLGICLQFSKMGYIDKPTVKAELAKQIADETVFLSPLDAVVKAINEDFISTEDAIIELIKQIMDDAAIAVQLDKIIKDQTDVFPINGVWLEVSQSDEIASLLAQQQAKADDKSGHVANPLYEGGDNASSNTAGRVQRPLPKTPDDTVNGSAAALSDAALSDHEYADVDEAGSTLPGSEEIAPPIVFDNDQSPVPVAAQPVEAQYSLPLRRPKTNDDYVTVEADGDAHHEASQAVGEGSDSKKHAYMNVEGDFSVPVAGSEYVTTLPGSGWHDYENLDKLRRVPESLPPVPAAPRKPLAAPKPQASRSPVAITASPDHQDRPRPRPMPRPQAPESPVDSALPPVVHQDTPRPKPRPRPLHQRDAIAISATTQSGLFSDGQQQRRSPTPPAPGLSVLASVVKDPVADAAPSGKPTPAPRGRSASH